MAVPLPRDDRYRTPPGNTPFGMDHRGITAHDIDAALEYARYGVQPDHLNEGRRYPSNSGGGAVPLPPRAAYASAHFDDGDLPGAAYTNGNNNHHQHQHQPRRDHDRHHEVRLNEQVRKTNLAVALANHNISHRAQFTQMHPMMCPDGGFPVDFQIPKTVESVRLFDNTQLDRILQAYRLPFETRLLALNTPQRHHHGGHLRGGGDLPLSSSRVRQMKLQVLFEHLGATRIVTVENEKMYEKMMKRTAYM